MDHPRQLLGEFCFRFPSPLSLTRSLDARLRYEGLKIYNKSLEEIDRKKADGTYNKDTDKEADPTLHIHLSLNDVAAHIDDGTYVAAVLDLPAVDHPGFPFMKYVTFIVSRPFPPYRADVFADIWTTVFLPTIATLWKMRTVCLCLVTFTVRSRGFSFIFQVS